MGLGLTLCSRSAGNAGQPQRNGGTDPRTTPDDGRKCLSEMLREPDLYCAPAQRASHCRSKCDRDAIEAKDAIVDALADLFWSDSILDRAEIYDSLVRHYERELSHDHE